MSDTVRIRAFRLGPHEVVTNGALAGMVGTTVPQGCTIVGSRVVDGWVELDIEGLELGSSIVTSLSTGQQHVLPPPALQPDPRWFGVTNDE